VNARTCNSGSVWMATGVFMHKNRILMEEYDWSLERCACEQVNTSLATCTYEKTSTTTTTPTLVLQCIPRNLRIKVCCLKTP
jgi:hypothetical protein